MGFVYEHPIHNKNKKKEINKYILKMDSLHGTMKTVGTEPVKTVTLDFCEVLYPRKLESTSWNVYVLLNKSILNGILTVVAVNLNKARY